MKRLLLFIVTITLIFVFSGCFFPSNEQTEGTNNKNCTIEKIKMHTVSESITPTVDCPSSFYITVDIDHTGTLTLDDIFIVNTDKTVACVSDVKLTPYSDWTQMKVKIDVIGENSCDIHFQNSDGSVKSETFSFIGMGFDGMAEYVLDEPRKMVHKRDCGKVGYISIDDRKYINEADFHYDYRKCEDCMSK